MFCVRCKREIPDKSLYCLYCGKKQVSVPARKNRKRPNGTGSIIDLGSRRKRRWAVRVTQGIDSSTGKQLYTYAGYYEKKTDAQQALDALQITPISPKLNLTLEQVYDEWRTIHFPALSKDGVNGYKSAWNYFEKYRGTKMRDIRTAHFQAIIDGAVSLGRRRAACEKIKQLCSQLSKYAMQNDIINKNYAEFVKLPKSDTQKKEIFSDEEIRLLHEHDSLEPARIILTLIYTGFRIGELFAITKEHVHLNEGYIVGGFKTEAGTNRTVPISPKIRPYIEDWYHTGVIPFPADESASNEAVGGNSEAIYLVPNENGEEIDIANFRKRKYYPTLEQIGIRRLTPHAARHTFASLMSRADVKPETLQQIIGHADYSTTANIYIHSNIDQLKEAIEKI